MSEENKAASLPSGPYIPGGDNKGSRMVAEHGSNTREPASAAVGADERQPSLRGSRPTPETGHSEALERPWHRVVTKQRDDFVGPPPPPPTEPNSTAAAASLPSTPTGAATAMADGL